MNKNTFFLMISLCLSQLNLLQANGTFQTKSVEEGQHQAAYEQKLLLVHFSANWCMPSRWMEENTFSDPEVQQLLRGDYLPVKVDVDLPQGFSDKETYQVASLPTILLFSASGQLLERIEGIAAADVLLDYLRKNNRPQNRWSRRPPASPAKAKTASLSDFSHLDKPAFATSEPTSPTTAISTPDLPMPPAEHIHPKPSPSQQPVVRVNREEYGVEVAVLQEYSSVIRFVGKLERRFDQKIYIVLRQENQQKNYHVIMGAYSNRREAYQLRSYLMEHQLKGAVTSLAFAKR